MAKLESILKETIVLWDIASKDTYNSGKYQSEQRRHIELIYNNGHNWSKDLHFP